MSPPVSTISVAMPATSSPAPLTIRFRGGPDRRWRSDRETPLAQSQSRAAPAAAMSRPAFPWRWPDCQSCSDMSWSYATYVITNHRIRVNHPCDRKESVFIDKSMSPPRSAPKKIISMRLNAALVAEMRSFVRDHAGKSLYLTSAKFMEGAIEQHLKRLRQQVDESSAEPMPRNSTLTRRH
jgi:hypothetical protein